MWALGPGLGSQEDKRAFAKPRGQIGGKLHFGEIVNSDVLKVALLAAPIGLF